MPKSTPVRIIDRAYGNVSRSSAYAASPTASSVGGVDAFVELSDAPNTYAGQGGKFVAVSAGESSLTFRTIVDGDIPNTLVRTSRALIGGDGIAAIGDLSADRTIAVDLDTDSGLAINAGKLRVADSLAGAALTMTNGVMAVNLGTNSALAIVGDGLVVDASIAGGGLSMTNGVMAVSPGQGINVSGDQVRVNLASPAGLDFNGSNQLQVADSLAGAGLAMAAKVMAVGAGNGISVAADSVAVNQAYGFAWTANHSWTGNLQHPSYASQTSKWRIDSNGGADFRYLFADELHVKSFVADLEQALAGGQIISKSVAMLSRDFTAPAAGAAATLYVQDLPSAEDMAVFQAGDLVRLRSFSRGDGSLTVADCWGVVTSYTNLTGKEQSWTFTRSVAPNAGAMTAGTVITADSLALDYGTTGNGFHEVNAIDGVRAVNSPYSQVVTWSGHPATGQTVRTRTGNLTGLAFPSQPANEYGFYAGNGRAVGDQYVRISTWGSELHNLPLRLYAGGVATVAIDPTYPSIAVGDNADSITYDADTNAGFFVGKRPATGEYTFRLGDEEQYIKWDGSSLEIAGTIVVKGGDFDLAKYRPSLVDLGLDTIIGTADEGDTKFIQFVRSGPYGGSGFDGICGQAVMDDGTAFNVEVNESTSTLVYMINVLTAPEIVAERRVVLLVAKNKAGGGGIDNPNANNTVLLQVIEQSAYLAQSAAYKAAYVIIGYAYLSSDYESVISISYTGSANTAIITADYIDIPNLAVIGNADLGAVTAGSIEVGETNKLWLNVDNDSLKLAIGGSSRTGAPFRVYDTGMFFAGDGSGNLQYIPGSGLSIKGTINADAGYLGNLNVTGNLSVDAGGAVKWAYDSGAYYGSLDSDGFYYADRKSGATAAAVRIGRPAAFAQGMIDIDMFTAASAEWDYAIHVTDGGNRNTSTSALYHGYSGIAGVAAIDRIFDAKSEGGSYSDGFYADMAAGISSGFNGSGAAFKGITRGGQAVAIFNQNGPTAVAPVVWASSDQSGRNIYQAEIGGASQVAFKVNNPYGYGGLTALAAAGGNLDDVGMLRLKSQGGHPGTPGGGYIYVYEIGNQLYVRTTGNTYSLNYTLVS